MFDAFSAKQKQDAMQIITIALENSLTMRELSSKLSTETRQTWEKQASKDSNPPAFCPDCDREMHYCSTLNGYQCKCGYSVLENDNA